jgi:alpha/beta superfamily hydrolase
MKLHAPALVIVASNDDLVPAGDAAEWAREAGVEITEVKGANHFFWAKYDALASVVVDFAERVVMSPPS